MKRSTLIAPAAMSAAILMTAGLAMAFPGQQQFGASAKVSLAQAQSVALKAVPGGKIVATELEKESGGSGLRYSFDVRIHGQTHEVGVDAKTGKLLENSIEGADSD